MTTQAYVLIKTEIGRLNDVADELRTLPGVKSADTTTGPYDIIVVVTGADLNAVGNFAVVDIQGIPGIVRTITCLVAGAAA